jgi:hypothetical protein
MEQIRKIRMNVRFGRWWKQARPKKMVVFWSWVAAAVLTIVIGFVWGGWTTGGSAREMAKRTAQQAVVERLAPICVAQYNQDPGKELKIQELAATSAYQRRGYVQDQGWATMPGEQRPDRDVADVCVELLMQIGQ